MILAVSSPPPPPTQIYDDHVDDFDQKKLNQKKFDQKMEPSSVFLRLLRLPFAVLRISGFFPQEPGIFRPKNAYSILMITFIVCTNLYLIIFKTAPSLAAMFTKWTIEVTMDFGICLYFCLSFTCLIFVVSFGYHQKFEKLSELMSNATNQKGLEMKYIPVEKKMRIMQIIILIATAGNFVVYLCLTFIGSLDQIMPSVVDTLTNLLGDSMIADLVLLFFAPIAFLALCQSVLLYWSCSKSLRVEFSQVNKDITDCDLSNIRLFKEIALRHSRLLKCLNYLHHEVALYVMCVFALGSLMSTLFMYVILLNEANLYFRLMSAYFLCLTAVITCILCLAAGGLHHAVKEAKERACSKVAEGSKDYDVDRLAYNIANMFCRQSALDNGITAFGFFTVSKGLLMTIYSFIATYVVILLQTPPSSNNSAATNSTSSH